MSWPVVSDMAWKHMSSLNVLHSCLAFRMDPHSDKWLLDDVIASASCMKYEGCPCFY